ncbi:hypothetical protein VTO42DRAFT_4982 [Malbranchea cinnamomea]
MPRPENSIRLIVAAHRVVKNSSKSSLILLLQTPYRHTGGRSPQASRFFVSSRRFSVSGHGRNFSRTPIAATPTLLGAGIIQYCARFLGFPHSHGHAARATPLKRQIDLIRTLRILPVKDMVHFVSCNLPKKIFHHILRPPFLVRRPNTVAAESSILAPSITRSSFWPKKR